MVRIDPHSPDLDSIGPDRLEAADGDDLGFEGPYQKLAIVEVRRWDVTEISVELGIELVEGMPIRPLMEPPNGVLIAGFVPPYRKLDGHGSRPK